MLIKGCVDASIKLGNRGWRKMTLYVVSTFSSHTICIISLYKTELYFYWWSTSNSLLFKWESWKHQFFQTVGNFRQHYCTFYGSFLAPMISWISIKYKVLVINLSLNINQIQNFCHQSFLEYQSNAKLSTVVAAIAA